MVSKRSEYQNQFKSSVIQKHNSIYRENLALRYERREREFMHTPLCWSDHCEDEIANTDSSEEEICPPHRAKVLLEKDDQVYQSLAEIMTEAKEKAEAIKKQRRLEQERPISVPIPSVEKMSLEDEDDVNKNLKDKELADKSMSICDLVDKENRKLNQKIAQAYVMNGQTDLFLDLEGNKNKCNVESETRPQLKEKESNLRKKKKRISKGKKPTALSKDMDKTSEFVKGATIKTQQPIISTGVPTLSVVSKSSKRPVRPDRQGRMSSTGKRRPASACSSQGFKKPPFIAFGAADVEDSLSLHRTHNVLAPADVYQPALRAKMRREEERRQNQERVKAARQKAGIEVDGLLDRLSAAGLTPRDDWSSEYRLQFHGYEPKEYERAVSARAVLPRAASAAPVSVSSSIFRQPMRSGGCKVVHVD